MLSPSKLVFADEIQAGILQSRHDQILEDLYEVDVGSLMEDERRKALKKEYNLISHRIEGLCCGCFKDPLSFLPAEVWVPIIRDATNENEDNLPSTDKLLTLTLVSKVWSELLLGTPVLWTELSIGHGEADAQAKLRTALLLSGNTLINLVVYAPQCERDADLSQIRHHAHRIQQITIRMSKRLQFGDSSNLKDFLRYFIPGFGPFPALRVLRGYADYTHLDFSIISSDSPGSTNKYGLKVPLEMMTRQRGVPLRSSPTNAPFGNVLEQLNELRNMEEIISVEEENNPGHHVHNQVSRLPALKTIHNRVPVDLSFFKILRGAENLTSLGLCIAEKWQHLHDIFQLIGHLPQLQSLYLMFHIMQGELSFPDSIPTRTHVRDLDVVIDMTEASKSALFLVFPVYFPSVTSLTLEVSTFRPSVATYISSLSGLKSLRLQVFQIVASDPVITSSSLESLHLSSPFEGCAQSLASTLKCPLLSELRWDAGVTGVHEPQGHTTEPPTKLLLYNGILSLKIASRYSHLSIPKFTALRKLHLDYGKYYGRLGACFGIPAVLISFIIEPYLCPALQELGLGHTPEWDLLFIMLEKRNYLPRSQRISPIETLILPTPIPPIILRPLIEILGRRFTERPSNLFLSFTGFIEQYFDPAIPGCQTCLKSMMHCSSAINKISARRILTIWPAPLAKRDFPESDDLSEWLGGREDRVLEWKRREASWNKSKRSRLPVCVGMALAQRPFTVTGTSFLGASRSNEACALTTGISLE